MLHYTISCLGIHHIELTQLWFLINQPTCKDIVMFKLLYNLTVISCGVPPPPLLRGEYNYTEVKYGDTVIYTCGSEYNLEGNQNLTCDVSGEWAQPPCCLSEYFSSLWVVDCHNTCHTYSIMLVINQTFIVRGHTDTYPVSVFR